jgi:ribosomal protein S18 acetylase RimI-like enzyme
MAEELMLEIRPSTSADLKEIAGWIRTKQNAELWAGWRVGFPVDLTSLAAEIGFAEDNSLSLSSERQLVAFGQLIRKPPARGHLGRIIVNTAFRGKGFGEILVRALLDRANEACLERISLNVDRANAVAVSLYMKLGFADTPRPSSEPEAPGSRYMELLIH